MSCFCLILLNFWELVNQQMCVLEIPIAFLNLWTLQGLLSVVLSTIEIWKRLKQFLPYWDKACSFEPMVFLIRQASCFEDPDNALVLSTIEIWNRLKQFFPLCIQVAFRTDWYFFSSLATCTMDTDCNAKGDTSATCTNNACACANTNDNTLDCSGMCPLSALKRLLL